MIDADYILSPCRNINEGYFEYLQSALYIVKYPAIMRLSYRFMLCLEIVLLLAASCNKNAAPVNPGTSGNPNDSLKITIISLEPTHGPYNTIDTITGLGLDQIPVPDSVLLNGRKVTIVSHTAGQIIVRIPLLAGTGNVDVWYKGIQYQGPVFKYDSVLIVTTIAGTTDTGMIDGKGSNARFYGPVGIAIDHQQNIYVADEFINAIRKIDTGGNVTTISGPNEMEGFADGTGMAARFSWPLGLCMGQDGFLYVADQFNYRVRKVSTSGVVTTLAGMYWYGGPLTGEVDGPATIATFDSPFGVTSDKSDNIYVADSYNNRIRKITPAGVVSTFAGGDYYHFGQKNGQGTSALFFGPTNVAADPSGNIYVIDGDGQLLRKITPDATVSTLLGPIEPGLNNANGLFEPSALACDKDGNLFFAISGGVIKMKPDGTIIRYAIGGVGGAIDGPLPKASFDAITGMAVDDAGTIYFTDNNRVRKIAWQ